MLNELSVIYELSVDYSYPYHSLFSLKIGEVEWKSEIWNENNYFCISCTFGL